MHIVCFIGEEIQTLRQEGHSACDLKIVLGYVCDCLSESMEHMMDPWDLMGDYQVEHEYQDLVGILLQRVQEKLWRHSTDRFGYYLRSGFVCEQIGDTFYLRFPDAPTR